MDLKRLNFDQYKDTVFFSERIVSDNEYYILRIERGVTFPTKYTEKVELKGKNTSFYHEPTLDIVFFRFNAPRIEDEKILKYLASPLIFAYGVLEEETIMASSYLIFLL